VTLDPTPELMFLRYYGWDGWRFQVHGGSDSTIAPIVLAPDITKFTGQTLNLIEDATAFWGHSTSREILNTVDSGTLLGTIPENEEGTAASSDGMVYDRIGVYTQDVQAWDAHSLSEDPLFTNDNTTTVVNRRVTVKTETAPVLRVKYSTGATDVDGLDIAGNLYNTDWSTMACGGEEGWTNQPLDIFNDPGSILGTYDTILLIPTYTPLVVPNGIARHLRYQTQSVTPLGTLISGRLTERTNLDNELSAPVDVRLRIDMGYPSPNATYEGGYVFTDSSTDTLSGISVVNYPTQIAFAESDTMVEPTSGWENIDSHTMNTTGDYSVWIRATDKAGNQATVRVYASLYIGGEISITKDTDAGALLHTVDCLDFEEISIASCGVDCSAGASRELEGESAFTYEITLTNTAASGNAVGTFEDYLPEGVTAIGTPTATSSGSATVSITSTLHHTGRYLISGSYSGLAPSETIDIEIPSETPEHDEDPGATNILRNQMESTWTIGSGAIAISGTTLSNHANHRVRSQGVATTFTKVKAEDITTGIAGAEFALYRWDGALAPTQAELEHIIDTSGLTDGDWTRVTLHGVDATSPSDIFESAMSPLGEVVIGNLQEGIYSLVETKAPSGYELPVGQWVLTIEPTASDTPGDYKIEFAGKSPTIMPPAAVRETSGGVHTYKIINARPFTVGMSGLSGTQGLLLLGFVIMAVAGNTYLAYGYKQRMKTK